MQNEEFKLENMFLNLLKTFDFTSQQRNFQQ